VKMDTGGMPTDHFAAICQGVSQGLGQEMGAILQKQHKLDECIYSSKKSSPLGVHNKQFHIISSMTIVANFVHVPPTY